MSVTVINQALMDAVERIAYEAGDAIMSIYARNFSVEKKADKSPLTEADKAAHTIVVRGLQALPEQFPILSEEDIEGFTGVDANGRYWLVDPLDGTKEFIKRNDEFTVNIALIENGKPVLGVVTAPALNVGFVAAQGLGAFKVEANGQRKAISVNGKPNAGVAWRVMGSRSHLSPDLAAWLEQLGEHTMLPMGSSLKMCIIAEGFADAYPRLGPASLWDTGAAHAVLFQVDGWVENLEGAELSYANPRETLNPNFIAWGH